METFMAKHSMQITVFDQCRTGAESQKTTQLISSPSVHRTVHNLLAPLKCNHRTGAHARLMASDSGDGVFRTKQAERFQPALNLSLAKAFLQPAPEDASWVTRMGSYIEPFTTSLLDATSYALAAVFPSVDVPEDAFELLEGIRMLSTELWDEPTANAAMCELAPIAAALAAQRDVMEVNGASAHVTSLPVWASFLSPAFMVSKARQNDSDNPAYRTAMRGPERDKWWEACENEMGNLQRERVFTEVPEDSLESWDPIKGRASEVADILVVLKKKYNELRELLKHKARFTVRGDQLAAADKKFNRTPAETFAPTMRHSTFKTICAGGVCRAKTAKHKLRFRSADVTAAFLQGRQPEGCVRHVRPPEGFRQVDRRGVPIV